MTKKPSVSSRRAKPVKKNRRTIAYTTNIDKDLRRVYKVAEDHINYSDIPPLDFDHLGKPIVGRFYKPLKKPISIRLDADVLDWFKNTGEKYQVLINRLCREYMQKNHDRRGDKS